MEESCKMDRMSSLPLEIFYKIVSHLDVADVLRAQAVSKKWYEAINTDIVWKPFWDPTVPEKDIRSRKEYFWMISFPCKWKMYYFNHIRIIKRWKEDAYKVYEVDGMLIRATAYDGHTLLINNVWTDVYKVERGTLSFVQKLKYKNFYASTCTTNTDYVAVEYEDAKHKSFIIIYKLNKDKYKVSHTLYNQGKKLVGIQQAGWTEKVKDQELARTPLMCLLGDTLFLYINNINRLFIWDMKNIKLISDFDMEVTLLKFDLSKVYIRGEKSILAYDKNGVLCYKIEPGWSIHKMLTNKNMIFVMKQPEDLVEIRGWEKMTGKEIVKKTIAISDSCLLHPTLDVLIDVSDEWSINRKEVFALDVKNDTTIWKTLMGEYSILGELHSIAAQRFLIFSTCSKNVFDIHDIKNGHYLYSMYDMVDDYNVFIYYDVLICYALRTGKLAVHIYS